MNAASLVDALHQAYLREAGAIKRGPKGRFASKGTAGPAADKIETLPSGSLTGSRKAAVRWVSGSKERRDVYHGTSNAAQVRRTGLEAREGEVEEGAGISVAPDKEVAKGYGEPVACKVRIMNPIGVKELNALVEREVGPDWEPGDQSRVAQAHGYDAMVGLNDGEIRVWKPEQVFILREGLSTLAQLLEDAIKRTAGGQFASGSGKAAADAKRAKAGAAVAKTGAPPKKIRAPKAEPAAKAFAPDGTGGPYVPQKTFDAAVDELSKRGVDLWAGADAIDTPAKRVWALEAANAVLEAMCMGVADNKMTFGLIGGEHSYAGQCVQQSIALAVPPTPRKKGEHFLGAEETWSVAQTYDRPWAGIVVHECGHARENREHNRGHAMPDAALRQKLRVSSSDISGYAYRGVRSPPGRPDPPRGMAEPMAEAFSAYYSPRFSELPRPTRDVCAEIVRLLKSPLREAAAGADLIRLLEDAIKRGPGGRFAAGGGKAAADAKRGVAAAKAKAGIAPDGTGGKYVEPKTAKEGLAALKARGIAVELVGIDKASPFVLDATRAVLKAAVSGIADNKIDFLIGEEPDPGLLGWCANALPPTVHQTIAIYRPSNPHPPADFGGGNEGVKETYSDTVLGTVVHECAHAHAYRVAPGHLEKVVGLYVERSVAIPHRRGPLTDALGDNAKKYSRYADHGVRANNMAEAVAEAAAAYYSPKYGQLDAYAKQTALDVVKWLGMPERRPAVTEAAASKIQTCDRRGPSKTGAAVGSYYTEAGKAQVTNPGVLSILDARGSQAGTNSKWGLPNPKPGGTQAGGGTRRRRSSKPGVAVGEIQTRGPATTRKATWRTGTAVGEIQTVRETLASPALSAALREVVGGCDPSRTRLAARLVGGQAVEGIASRRGVPKAHVWIVKGNSLIDLAGEADFYIPTRGAMEMAVSLTGAWVDRLSPVQEILVPSDLDLVRQLEAAIARTPQGRFATVGVHGCGLSTYPLSAQKLAVAAMRSIGVKISLKGGVLDVSVVEAQLEARMALASHMEAPYTKGKTCEQDGMEFYQNAGDRAAAIFGGNRRMGVGVVAELSPGTPWDINIGLAREVKHLVDHAKEYGLTADSTPKEFKAAMDVLHGQPIHKQIMAQETGGKGFATQTGEFTKAAFQIAQGQDPEGVVTGQKRRNFTNNMGEQGSEDTGGLTIDTHMAKVFSQIPGCKITGRDAMVRFLNDRKSKAKGAEIESFGYAVMAEAVARVAARHHLQPKQVQAIVWNTQVGEKWPAEKAKVVQTAIRNAKVQAKKVAAREKAKAQKLAAREKAKARK